MSIVNPNSPLPLYAQVKETLQREIEQNMQPGQNLPIEPELEKRFGVSRVTVRRALEELESDGLIIRKQGRGTFVREPKIAQELTQLKSWGESIRQSGLEPQTVSSEIDVLEPTLEISQSLALPPGTKLVRVRRLRFANGDPICIMTNYLPQNLIPNLEENGLVNDSIYRTMAHYNLKPVRAFDKVEARPATPWEAEQLQVAVDFPLLEVTRLVYDAAGKPLYLAVITNRSDKYVYTVHFGNQL
jgi:GntR family transcriptional regulator